LPEIAGRPGTDWVAPTGRRRLGGDIALPDQDGPTHARKRAETPGWPRFHAPRRSWRSAGTIFGRGAGAASAGTPGPRRPLHRCRRRGVGASGRRGVGASGARTQHGPALNARFGPAGRPFQVQGRREKSDQPGPGRVRSSDGPTLTRGRRRMSQRRRDRAFDADGARAGSVPAAGTTPWSCRDDAVQQPGPCQRRRSPSSQRIFTRSWKPSPPS